MGYISLDVNKSRLFLVHIHSIYVLMSIMYPILFILCVKGSILISCFLYSKVFLFTALPFLPPLNFCSSFLRNVNHTSLKNRQAFILYFFGSHCTCHSVLSHNSVYYSYTWHYSHGIFFKKLYAAFFLNFRCTLQSYCK